MTLLGYQQCKCPPLSARSAPAVQKTKPSRCGHSLRCREARLCPTCCGELGAGALEAAAAASGLCVGRGRVPPGPSNASERQAVLPLVERRALTRKWFVNLGVGPRNVVRGRELGRKASCLRVPRPRELGSALGQRSQPPALPPRRRLRSLLVLMSCGLPRGERSFLLGLGVVGFPLSCSL